MFRFFKYESLPGSESDSKLMIEEAQANRKTIEAKMDLISIQLKTLAAKKQPFYQEYNELQTLKKRAQDKTDRSYQAMIRLETEFTKIALERKLDPKTSIPMLIDERLTLLRTEADKRAQPITAVQTLLVEQQAILLKQLSDVLVVIKKPAAAASQSPAP